MNGESKNCSPPHRRLANVLFLCLARNCESSLPGFFAFLKHLRTTGIVCEAVVGENGSTDKTRTLIDLGRSDGIELIDTGFMTGETNRLARMAQGREALLEYAKARKNSAEFICIADLDNVMAAPPCPTIFRDTIKELDSDNTLFAIGANSYPVFYDLLAFRNEQHDYTSLYLDIEAAKSNPLTYYHFHKVRIYRQQKLISNEPAFVRCYSSFNGLCIYRAADYFVGSYRSPAEKQICEHVSLNLAIVQKTGKQMQVSRKLLLQAPSDHVPVTLWRFWKDRLLK